MPIDDLTALGQKMREARKNKELTQQELSDFPLQSYTGFLSFLTSFSLKSCLSPVPNSCIYFPKKED